MKERNINLINHTKLRSWGLEFLHAVGLEQEDAVILLDALLEANLRGVDTHGIAYLPIYVKRMEMGLIDKSGKVKILQKSASYVSMDGGNALGHVIAHKAINQAIELANASGVGAVSVKNANHCGVMALYTLMAANAGCIGIGFTNSPPTVAPWGGRTAFFGTNPISIAVPCGKEPPLVLDMATTEVARAKVVMAERRGEEIPLGWALDPNGDPTTDPKEALKGTMLPMSGHKGSGLALMIDIIAGILTGAASGRQVGPLLFGDGARKQNVGIFFITLDVEHFIPLADFTSRVDNFIQQIRKSPPAPGTRSIRLPGDGGRQTAEVRRREGIPVSNEELTALKELGKQYKVALIV